MKNKFRTWVSLLILLVNPLFYHLCCAQYDLQIETGQVYQEISNPTYEIPDHSQYFGNVTTKPDMFFKAFGKDYDLYDNVFIPIKEGYCYFDNGVRSSTLYACKGDFTKRPGQTSVFSFKTDTTSGNRKFIMQWKNMGFLNGHDTDYINFQVWLYEKDGTIEFRFGPGKARPGLFENGANGPTIGLLEMDASFSTIFHQTWLKGNPSNPQVVYTNSIINLDGIPANGTVYRFIDNHTGIGSNIFHGPGLLYPNPVKDILNIDLRENPNVTSISIVNLTGIELLSIDSRDKMMRADVSFLEPGIYFLQVIDQNGNTSTHKFSKE